MASFTSASLYGPVTVSGTVTSYLPLATSWSAPEACSTLYLHINGYPDFYADDPNYHNGVPGGPTCVPLEISTWWYGSATMASTAYSLGGYSFACPSAYSTAYNATVSSTATVTCCPTSYTLVETTGVVGVAACRSMLPSGSVTYMVSDPASSAYTPSSTYISRSATLWAPQIAGYIFNNEATISSSTSGTGTSITSSASHTSTATSKSGGLSSGAKAGVGIGVALVVIALAAVLAAVLLWRRKRSKISQTQYAKPELDATGTNTPNLMPNDWEWETTRHEMESEIPNQRGSSHELPGASSNDRLLAAEMD